MGYIKNVHYSVDANCYDCDYDVTFSENVVDVTPSYEINSQKIILDGEVIGLLQEYVRREFIPITPMNTSFILFVNDGVEIDDEHFIEDEWDYMSFGSLRECIDWYLGNKDLVNTNL